MAKLSAYKPLEKDMKLITKLTPSVLAASIVGCLITAGLHAHTTIVHTEDMALERARDVEMALIFTHATDGGPTMPLELESFSHYSGRFLNETDLMDTLEPMQWLNRVDENGNEVRVNAFKANIERDRIRSIGDHQLVAITEPYFDENDGLYIQQFVKVIMNVSGGQTNWFSSVGLPTEIQALKTPYANWVGETFSGIVYSEGRPVPFARLEIDYLNYAPDMENQQFADEPFIAASHPSYKYISIMANENGEFHFGIPAAGWWAIAALGTGPEVSLNDEYLSQDAILWIYAENVPLTEAGKALNGIEDNN